MQTMRSINTQASVVRKLDMAYLGLGAGVRIMIMYLRPHGDYKMSVNLYSMVERQHPMYI